VNPPLLEAIPAAHRGKVQRVFEGQQQAFEPAQQQLHQEILRLRQLVRLYQIDNFGASSEKLTDFQMAVLHLQPSVSCGEVEAEAQLPESQKTVAGAPALEDLAQETRQAHATIKAKSKKQLPREDFPAELPRRERRIEAAPEACRCGICGGQTRIIGYEQSERLSVEPVRYFEIIRLTFEWTGLKDVK
jgi:hypothetical protein